MDGIEPRARASRGVNTAPSRSRTRTLIGLIAKGRDGAGNVRGWVYQPATGWRPDRAAESSVPLATLLADAGTGTERTFTAVLKNNELRMGIDQDGDGYPDQDEEDVGADPNDPASTPADFVGVEIAGTGARAPARRSGSPVRILPARSRGLGISLRAAVRARVDVFDLAGRRVRTLVDRHDGETGRFEQRWDLMDGTGRRGVGGRVLRAPDDFPGLGRRARGGPALASLPDLEREGTGRPPRDSAPSSRLAPLDEPAAIGQNLGPSHDPRTHPDDSSPAAASRAARLRDLLHLRRHERFGRATARRRGRRAGAHREPHVALRATLDQYPGYSDIWGYTAPERSREYALLGTTDGVSVVNVSDPYHPYETGFNQRPALDVAGAQGLSWTTCTS